MTTTATNDPAATTQPAQTATPAASGAASNFGDWKTQIPDDLRASESLKTINSIGDLAKSYVHAQSMIGAKRIAIPGPNATPEEITAFHKSLGRPDKPEEYEYPTQGLPEGVTFDDQSKKDLSQVAFDLGLNKQQAAMLARRYADFVANGQKNMVASMQQEAEKAVADLRKEFGAAFDERISLAKSAVKKFGGEELVKFLDQSGLGNNPALVKAFSNIGKAIASDEIHGEGSGRTYQMTPGEAKSKIDALKQDKDFLHRYTTKHAVGHDEAVRQMSELFALAHP